MYTVDGRGRDTYISLDNGGLFAKYSPDMQLTSGAFNTRQKSNERSLCRIPSKHVGYYSNGQGRDSYIAKTNGGFYPEQPVAAY